MTGETIQILDLETLRELQLVMPDELIGVFEIFAEDTRAQLARLAECVDDPQLFAKVSHSLKGGAASVGATRLAAQFYALEILARADELLWVGQQLNVARDCFIETLAALRHWRTSQEEQ